MAKTSIGKPWLLQRDREVWVFVKVGSSGDKCRVPDTAELLPLSSSCAASFLEQKATLPTTVLISLRFSTTTRICRIYHPPGNFRRLRGLRVLINPHPFKSSLLA